MFTILIPSWNNRDYLANCVDSLRRNSTLEHQVLVHVNEGRDGSADWCRQQRIEHTRSPNNIGICLALNGLAAHARHPWLVYLNDDMVACPGWDRAFAREIAARRSRLCLLSGRLIEPIASRNQRVLFQDFGADLQSFRRTDLDRDYLEQQPGSVRGASQPTVVHRSLWAAVGGYSVEFSPGMSSDDDFVMKLWAVGCRDFMIIDDARFYHFGQVSTGRIRKNLGSKAFLQKWGISHKTMYHAIDSGSAGAAEALLDPPWTIRFKRASQALLNGAPRQDVRGFQAQLGDKWCADANEAGLDRA